MTYSKRLTMNVQKIQSTLLFDKEPSAVVRNESALGIYSWIFQKPFTLLIMIREGGVILVPFYYAL